MAAFGVIFIAGLASAQPASTQPAASQAASDDRPETAQSPQAPGSIGGTVKDASGSAVAGAVVTLETAASTARRMTATDQAGSFHFAKVQPGAYTVAIAAPGFAPWTAASVMVRADEIQPPLSAVVQVAPVSTKVDVGLPQHELAAEQLKAEEKQRLLGIFPHYFVSYEPNAAPLTASQKFQLGWKTVFDPVPLVTTGISAGIQQARNSYPEFGQGLQGYGTRYGVQYADRLSAAFIGHVVMQSVFHQDPRYFYKGTGGIRSRALYAIATAFVCKGDNGHWQPDYSDVLGGMAAGEISSLYHPATSRPVRRLFDNVLVGFGGGAGRNLFEEFLLRKFTAHVPKTAESSQPVLREGTPVSLVSVNDLSAKAGENAGPIEFLLTTDLQVGGAIVAKAGSKAWGKVNYAGAPGAGGEAMHVGLERVRLQVGNAQVPLRSSQLRQGADGLAYHQLENSGRISVVLYVAQNFPLPPAR